MKLKHIQPTIQQIVIAIASVLKIEVEIADDELFRVAGTGVIKPKIWKEMRNEDYVYRKCLETGEPVIVQNPGKHDICQKCIHFQNCDELGEVCCPIYLDKQVIGVIGLIAFNSDQKNRLFDDLDANISFLEKMSDLIASKIKETEFYDRQLMTERKISTLINYIDNGILMFNYKGDCEYMNPAAKLLLEANEFNCPSKEILGQMIKNDRFHHGKESEHTITLKIQNEYKQLLAKYHPLSNHSNPQNAVIILEDPDHITLKANKLTESSTKGFEQIIGNHLSIQLLKQFARKISNSASSVLIRGEKGVGKETFASSIHHYNGRSEQNFISINCAVYPEVILDHLLFGTTINLSTETKKISKLEEADGGTLFLDDISDLPLSLQLKLLQFLEEKKIQLNGNMRHLDIRVITATDKDLLELVSKGLFRQDLYYKLNIIPLHVPALRERKEDILLIANYFLQKYSVVNKKYVRFIDDEVKKILMTYHWPGNIRELSNVIEYAVNFETGKYISVKNLPHYLQNIVLSDSKISLTDLSFNLRVIEKEAIKKAIHIVKKEGRAKENAAELLGIGRATLFRKIKEYQLEV